MVEICSRQQPNPGETPWFVMNIQNIQGSL